jgi:hypothetical protein
MGFLDMLGITKRVKETDLIRKKEEIDALYAEMLTITDNLTKTAQKIKDLKDQINKLPPDDDKKEADNNKENKTEVTNNNVTDESEPKPETESEPIKDDAQENEDQSLVENAAPDIQQAADNSPAVRANQSMEQPSFGIDTSQTVPLVSPNNAMNNTVPVVPGNFTGQRQPSQMLQQPSQYQMQQQQSYAPQNNNLYTKNYDGGKKKRKTKSATSLKRKRRTRRNKKAGAHVDVAAAAAPAAAEAATET